MRYIINVQPQAAYEKLVDGVQTVNVNVFVVVYVVEVEVTVEVYQQKRKNLASAGESADDDVLTFAS